MPLEAAELEAVVLPEGWPQQKDGAKSNSAKAQANQHRENRNRAKAQANQAVMDVLGDGIPGDDPVPGIIYPGRSCSFTGDFKHGKRKTVCVPEIEKGDGRWHPSLGLKMDYLIVGARMSKAWKNKSYGGKILAAVCNNVVGEIRTKILAEAGWAASLEGVKLVPIK